MTERYAVIGHPVEHSRSPEIHAAFAEQTGEDIVYERLPAAADAFVETAARFFADGGAGLNVTLPFKAEAARFADLLTERAIAAGWKTSGATPHATLYAAMIREIRDKGNESRFQKVDRGLFKAGKGGA